MPGQFEVEDPEDAKKCAQEGCGHSEEDHDEDTGICMLDECSCEEFIEDEEA